MVALLTDARPRTHAKLRTTTEVHAAAAAFRRVARPVSPEHGYGGKEVYLTVGPSMLKLGERRIDTTPYIHGMSREDWISENVEMATAVLEDEDDAPRRGKITGWSQKSRNNMRVRLGTLDYSPLFKPDRTLPKMLTFSMPARWETVAPSAQAFKVRLIDNTLKRTFRRHWGYDLVGVWKLEFQKRGAPHLHLLTSLPTGDCPKTGETAETWFRRVWAKACKDADTTEQEYRDHLAKGVHVADTYGLTGTDAKRVADYFTKHGVFSAKEYQNQAPDLWADETGKASPGRFWGYWGLKRADGETVLGVSGDAPRGPGAPSYAGTVRGGGVSTYSTVGQGGMPEHGNYVSPAATGPVNADGHPIPVELVTRRILRRWAKANGKHRKVRRTVPDLKRIEQLGDENVVNISGKYFDATTGEALEKRLSLWSGPFVGGKNGFVSVNDGVEFAAQLLAAVEQRPYRPAEQSVDARVSEIFAERDRRLAEYQAAIDRLSAA